MGSTVSATIKINDAFSGPLDKLSAGLTRSASTMGNLSKSASGTGGMFKSVLGGTVIGAGITRGIGAIGNGLRSMYGELDESSRAWQTFNGNMSMLGQSKSQIASTRGDLQKFAQQTIYSASDMASTYSQLAAVGTKNTGQLVKGFGGLAAASSNPQQAMKTLSQQATQAAAKPKIQWMDFKLMLEQTPAGMAAVAKTMHKSTGQLVKDMQAGKVKTQDFFDAIAKTGTNKNFSKMATQYKTIGQAMDGLRETAANKLQPAFDKVSQVGIKAISGLVDSMGSMNVSGIADGIVPVVQSIVDAIQTAGQAVGAFWDSLSSTGAVSAVKSTIGDIAQAMGDMLGKLSSSEGKDPFAMFKTLGSISGGAIKGLANGIGAIARAVGQLPSSSIKLLAGAFVALKMSTRGLIFTAAVAGLTALSKLNPGTLNALAKTITVLAIAFAMFKGVQNVVRILSGFKNSLGALGGSGGLGNLAKQTPQAAAGFIKLGASLVLVGGAIVLAGAGMMLLAKATTTLVAAGWPAIALFAAMVVGIGILAAVVSKLGASMLAGSVGFIVFAAALLLIGASIALASAGVALLATQLPTIAAYGVQAAGALILLGAAMAVFGALSLIASVGLVMLGVTLTVAAVGALLFGAAMMLVAAGSFIAFAGLILVFTGSMMAMMGLMLVMTGGMMAMMGLMMVMMGAMMAFTGLILVMTGGLMAMVGLMMVMVGGTLAMVGLMMVMTGAMMAVVGLTMIMAVSMIAAAGLTMVGTMAMAASVGMMALAGATTMVASQVAAIASSAASAAASLTGMVAAVSVVKAGLSTLGSAARSAVNAFISALRGGVGNAAGAGRALANAATNGMKSGVGAARSAGAMIGAGLAAGLRSQVGAVAAAANALVAQANRAARAAAKIHSPSKLFAEIGDYMGQGMAIGMNNTQSLIASAGRTMAHTAMDSATIGTNPGDMLADGFDRAYAAVMGVVGAVRGIHGKTIGVMGQVMGPDGITPGGPVSSTVSDVPSSTPFTDGATSYAAGASYSDSTTSTSSTGNTINIAPGAIQVTSTGNADYDVETLVGQFEDYLMNLKERRG